MDVKIFFVILCLTLGSFLIIVASIGVVRFPDFYTRVHAAGKVDTLGQSLILLALIIYEGFSPLSLKIFLIIILIYRLIRKTIKCYIVWKTGLIMMMK